MSANLPLVRRLAEADHGLAVIVTTRADSSPTCGIVNAGVMNHPVHGRPVVAFVSRGDAARLKNLRRWPRATAVFRAGWEWAAVEGHTTLAGPDDELEGLTIDVPRLLRDVFTSAGGTHQDWDEYDRVMALERRTAVFIEPNRIYSNPGRSEA